MTSLPEQLSAASTRQLSAQLDAQFRFFHTVASQALDHAGRLAALNLSASRDSVERSSHALRQLTQASQPGDLLVLRTHAEDQMRSLLDYGRALFNMTASIQAPALRTIASAPQAAFAAAPLTLAAPPVAPVEAAEAAELAVTAAAEATTEAVDTAIDDGVQAADATVSATAAPVAQATPAPVAEPVMVQQEPPLATAAEVEATVGDASAPVAAQTPIARAAAGKSASRAATAPHPLAAQIEGNEASAVARVDRPSRRRK